MPRQAGGRAEVPGYEILRELGRGGMGVVYLARQVKLNRVVALKMILSGGHAGPEELQRFLTEAEAVAQLQHPNIVQIFESGECEGLPYFSLEYVQGGTLAALVREQPLPPREAARLVEQLARGVAYAHAHGIVHRDLKPENVLLATEDTENTERKNKDQPSSPSVSSVTSVAHLLPKIADFGLAKRLELDAEATRGPQTVRRRDQTHAGAVVGTPSYMGPEQARGDVPNVGPLADVYALGAILYRILTGRPPFQAASVTETLLQVIGQEPVAPTQLQPGLPRDLETITLKCLQKEPSRRYGSAQELAEDLRRYLAGEHILARPVGRVERAAKWVRRKPAAAGLFLMAGILGIGAVVGLMVWQQVKYDHQRQMFEAEQARQREMFEVEQSRQKVRQRRAEQTAALRGVAAAEDALAVKELRAGRFADAERVLARAAETVRVDDDLKDVLTALEKRRARARRLADFYRLADLAEYKAFAEAVAEAEAACRAAVRVIGVLDHPKDWAKHLPTADLDDFRRHRLHDDVNAALMLLAALRVKEGLLLRFGPKAPPGGKEKAKKSFQAALDALDLADDIDRWHIGRLVRYVCRHNLDPKSPQPPRPPDDEPANGYDCYGLGMIHLWLSRISPQTGGPDNDVLTQALLKVAVGNVGWLDTKTPWKTADRLFHKAIELGPEHYWSHHWLGWCYLGANPPQLYEAEMCFTRCIELRPGYPVGYAERGRVRSQMKAWAAANKIPDLEKELERRVLEDYTRALERDPYNAYTHWLYAQALANSPTREPILREAALAADLEAPFRAPDGRLVERNTTVAEMVIFGLANWAKEDPPDLEVLSVVARAQWILDRQEDALATAARVLEKEPGNVRALGVRGSILLHRGQTPAPLADFDAVLAKAPADYLARVGRARVLEVTGQKDKALAEYTTVSEAAGPDWQRVEGHLGRARVLDALGKKEEARAARLRAEELMPGVIDSLER